MHDRARHGIVVTASIALVMGGACRQMDVVAVEVANVVVQPEVLSLLPGETGDLAVSLRSQDGDELVGRTIEWSSSDETVARVSAEGKVTAVAEGDARITARVGGAEGAATVRVAPAPPATRPEAPGRLRADAPGDRRIRLAWDDRSGNESSFRVQRAHSVISGWTFERTLPANVTEYTDEGLESDHRYWYRVQACNEAGCSASEVVSKRTRED